MGKVDSKVCVLWGMTIPLVVSPHAFSKDSVHSTF